MTAAFLRILYNA